MRIVFFGSGEFAVPTLKWLRGSEHEIPLVITQPARAGGRGLHLTPTPVARVAGELALAVLEVAEVNRAEVVERVQSLRCDLGLVIAFGQKIGASLRASAPLGFINLHASILPRYRGAAPINWAIICGERTTGCTVFRLVDRMDAGPVLAISETAIGPDETAGELHDRLAVLGVETVRAALNQFAEGANPPGIPQNEAAATKARKLTKADGAIDFQWDSAQIIRRIRGVTPWPGAHAKLLRSGAAPEEVILVKAAMVSPASLQATPLQGKAALEPRESLPSASKDASPMALVPGMVRPDGVVGTGDGAIRILRIKPAGGKEMDWRAFANGRRIEEGAFLVDHTST